MWIQWIQKEIKIHWKCTNRKTTTTTNELLSWMLSFSMDAAQNCEWMRILYKETELFLYEPYTHKNNTEKSEHSLWT